MNHALAKEKMIHRIWLQTFIVEVLAILLRVKRRFTRRNGGCDTILLIPPASPGSLGDEAMVTSTIEYLKQSGVKNVGLISYSKHNTWEYSDPRVVNVCLQYDWQSWRGKWQFARICSDYGLFLMLGADVLDGHYSVAESLSRISLLSIARLTGASVSVLGFSFNDHPAPEVINEIRRLPTDVRLCARDPISKLNLERNLDRPIVLTADVAFLLAAQSNTDYVHGVHEWAEMERTKGRTLLGFNANYLHASHTGSIHKLAGVYANSICELSALRSNLSFILIPHDSRSSSDDILLLNAIRSMLPDSIRDHCLSLEIRPAIEVKAICGLLDLVCSGRMHLAIACLSETIPVVCLAYQGKFEGLFKYFELEDLVISPERALQPHFLGEYLLQVLDRRDEITQKISDRMPTIESLARGNFDFMQET